jgi:BASS family bile acid:Na+ symporter
MDPAQLIKLALTASILLLVFALGMRASFAGATSLFRELFRSPHRLLRALFAMFVLVPLAAVLAAKLLDLSLPVRTAIVAMALAPIPPVLPGKQLKFGGESDYVFGLLVAVSLAAMLIVPLGLPLMSAIFHRETGFGFWIVARIIGMTILVPLLAGLTLKAMAPALAGRLVTWVARIGTLLLLTALIPVLVSAWPALVTMVGDGGVAAIALVVVTAIAAGHVLGGPDPDERTALAFATAMRHPGIAVAIAGLAVPEEPRVQAAILLYLLIAVVATSIYGLLHKRRARAAG